MARLADVARIAAAIALGHGIAEDPLMRRANRSAESFEPSGRIALMHATTCSYVFRAYPLWLLAHPTQDCPAALDELTPYTRFPDLMDPGTGVYQMRCDPRSHHITVSPEDDVGSPGTEHTLAASNAVSIASQWCRFDPQPEWP